MHTCSHAQNMDTCSHRHRNSKACTPVTIFCSSKMRAAIARVQAKVHARNNGVGPADAAGVGQADDPGVGQADGPGGVGLIRARTGRRSGRVKAAETAEERIEAGQQYRKDLLTRFASAKMHAVDVCATAYLHTRSGGLGAADLALPPGQDGNAMRTIRHALGVETRRRAYINVPQWNSEKARREIRPLEVRFPHEAIAHDFERNPYLYDKSMVDASEYRLEQYTQHPVTVTHGEADVWPIGYYTDKVALGRNEYFYRGSGGVTFVRKRLTFWIIAGNDICKCGCGGACTIDAVQIEMNHSFNLLQEKIYMPCRRDGLPWLRSDSWRSSKVAERHRGPSARPTPSRPNAVEPKRRSLEKPIALEQYATSLRCHHLISHFYAKRV